jgi:hypothetical protein
LTSRHAPEVMVAVLIAFAALLCGLLALWLPLAPLRDHVVVAALGLTLCAWLVWFLMCEAIARFNTQRREEITKKSASVPNPAVFDLNAHLDSPQAQEGADKYTRE